MTLKGTVLASRIVPSDSNDTYGTHEDEYGIGGHRSVINIAARDAIPDARRKTGMTVYVNDINKEYRLVNGITNTNWVLEPDSSVINDATNTALATKVDKEVGKQLSQENYTTAEKQKLANLTDNFKGGYATNQEMIDGVPNPQTNFYVLRFDTNTFWYYKSNAWTNTGSLSSGDMLKAIYDPTGKNGDVFSMANMVETLDAKIMTALERSKLANIEAGAEKNKVTAVNNKTGNVILTKQDIQLSNVDNTADVDKVVKQAGRVAYKLTINGEEYDGSVAKNITVAASSITFATDAEVSAGVVADKAIAPKTLADNYYGKASIDTRFSDLHLVTNGYNLYELPSSLLGVEVKMSSRHPESKKPYYTRTVNFGALPNATTKTVNHTIPNVEYINFDFNQSFVLLAGGTYPITVAAPANLSQSWYSMVDATKIQMYTGVDRTAATAKMTLIYTKTTDTAETPTGKVPITLQGLSELPSANITGEVLTASRHSVTGKPIYTRTFDFGALPNAGNKTIPHNIPDVEDISYDYNESAVTIGTASYPLVLAHPTILASSWYPGLSKTNVIMITGSDRTTATAKMVLLYTKTTDTASSPVALLGGKGERGQGLYEYWLSVGNTGTEEQFVDDMRGKITLDVLTSEQLAQLNGRILTFGQFNYKNATAVAHTIGTTKIPVFTTKKIGELVADNITQFTLKANVTYLLDFSVYASPVTNQLAVAIVNDLDNSLILNKDDTIGTSTVLSMLSSGVYYTPLVDTPISLRIVMHNNLTTGTITASIYDSTISITEFSSVELKLSNLTINGKVVDENNNVDLEGVGNLASPKLNTEVLTEFRHSISGKPIYYRTINFGALPNATTKTVTLGIVDAIDTLWIDPTFSHSGSFPIPSNYYANSDGFTFTVSVGGKSVTAKANGNYSAHSAYITVRYTKTADTAASPIRLVGGNVIV